MVQRADVDLREAFEVPLAAHREDQPDRLRRKSTRHEGQGLRRGRVEPLRIVHYAGERPLLRDLEEKAQEDPCGPAAAATLLKTLHGAG